MKRGRRCGGGAKGGLQGEEQRRGDARPLQVVVVRRELRRRAPLLEEKVLRGGKGAPASAGGPALRGPRRTRLVRVADERRADHARLAIALAEGLQVRLEPDLLDERPQRAQHL